MACESEDDNTGLGYGIVMLVSLCLSGPGLRKVLPLYAYCAYQRITYHTCHVLRITRINVLARYLSCSSHRPMAIVNLQSSRHALQQNRHESISWWSEVAIR